MRGFLLPTYFCHKSNPVNTKYFKRCGMSSFWALIILGIVQGVTEFLPVSSSGHLVLLSKIFGIENSLFVSIVLHVATLLSILVVLRKEVWRVVRHPFRDEGKKLIVATIPTCLIVLCIYPLINEAFEGAILPICFIITAILLFVTSAFCQKKSFSNLNNETQNSGISYKQALFMGISQGFATFPGISRSGATICTGVIAGAERENVAKFSFLMSVPVIVLSMAFEIFKLVRGGEQLVVNVPGLVLAFFLAFVVGLLCVKAMIKLTQKLNFKWFSLYLVILAILTLFI